MQFDILPFLYVKSGIQYTKYNRSFNYQENLVKTVEEDVITDIHISYLGDTATVSELQAFEKNITRYWTRQQHLNQIDIPVYVGIYKNVGSWRTYLETGIHINVFQWFDGAIMDENFSVVFDPDIYRSSFTNQLSIGAGALCHVNEKIGIDASIQYGRSINSATAKEYSLKENTQQLGLRLAIVYKL